MFPRAPAQLFQGLLRFHRRFARGADGVVAVMYALTAFVLVGFMGLAIDYGRQREYASRLQFALDSAVLAATNILVEDERRQEVFTQVLATNFSKSGVEALKASYTYSSAGGHGIVSALLPTRVISVFGRETLDVRAESWASQADTSDLEVALVLDVSGSMKANMGTMVAIDALKSAATRLIDLIEANKKPGQTVRYAVIPFTMNVNIGTANSAFVEGTGHGLFSGQAWAGCVMERPAPYHNQDVYSGAAAGGDGRWHAYFWPPEPNSAGMCVNPGDGTNGGYARIDAVGTYGPYDAQTAGPNFNCVRHAITPLSTDATAVKNAISNLTAEWNQGTIIAPGVAWGHRVLSPEEPFTGGAVFNGTTRKVMVVITDGEQTTEGPYWGDQCTYESNTTVPYSFNPAAVGLRGRTLSGSGPRDMFSPYGYLLDSNPFDAAGAAPSDWTTVSQQLYDLSLNACQEFKNRGSADKVEIFTIAASIWAGPGTTVYNLLQACATSAQHFFHVTDDAQLMDAFLSVAHNATQLRITQ